MAEKSAKKKTKKAAKAETGVLGNLSATRPTRLGGDRSASRATKPTSSAAAAKTTAATKPKPATSATPKAATKAKVRTNAGTQPKPPSAPPAGWQAPDDDGRKGRPGGTEIVGTAVQAAGEIAQLGLAVGGQILKRAASRIPRP
jgi:hypothetical protein